MKVQGDPEKTHKL